MVLQGCKWHKPEGCSGPYQKCPFCLMLPCLTILQKISNHLELVKGMHLTMLWGTEHFGGSCYNAQQHELSFRFLHLLFSCLSFFSSFFSSFHFFSSLFFSSLLFSFLLFSSLFFSFLFFSFLFFSFLFFSFLFFSFLFFSFLFLSCLVLSFIFLFFSFIAPPVHSTLAIIQDLAVCSELITRHKLTLAAPELHPNVTAA